MNLDELADGLEIVTDDNSGYRFGINDESTVIGWYKRINYIKQYIVKCSICSNHPLLYGDGYFSTDWGRIRNNVPPCGCSKSYRYTEAEYSMLCNKALEGSSYKFIGWEGSYTGSKTRCIVSCDKHGEWSVKGYHLILKGSRCKRCSLEITLPKMWDKVTIPDDVYIKRFMDSGCFAEETEFERDMLDKCYWTYSCPRCNDTGRSQSAHLLKGQMSCACSAMRQRFSYISVISDGTIPLAVKFGVTKDSITRNTQQNLRCIYSVDLFGVWEFENVASCKEAERLCKSTLVCSILSKQEMKDGWTETTAVYNLDKIIQIFEDCGGIRINN